MNVPCILVGNEARIRSVTASLLAFEAGVPEAGVRERCEQVSSMLGGPDIAAKVQAFQSDLVQLTPADMVNKHVLTGSCCMLPDDEYVELRRDVAAQFGVSAAEVVVVGSTRLGFSIAPDKRYRQFGEESDIDVAIISDRLFSEIWEQVHRFHDGGGYWEDLGAFRKYLYQGWIRPDKLPAAESFARAKEWWDFFTGMTATNKFGPFKVTAGLYKSWYFLESYQLKSIRGCFEARTL